jgi:hypothetical protein
MSEITGVVINQSPGKQTNIIQSGDEQFVISPYSRIKGAGGHGCYVEVGDELKFERPELGQKFNERILPNYQTSRCLKKRPLKSPGLSGS